MLSIGVRLMMESYSACEYDDFRKAEWPPHPARLFSALVCSWKEAGLTPEDEENERRVLTLIEGLSPPDILCSDHESGVAHRTAPDVFVKMNSYALNAKVGDSLSRYKQTDKISEKQQKSINAYFHEGEKRARSFPVVTPDVAEFAFVWTDVTLSGEDECRLSKMLARICRLGRSSSFILARLLTQSETEELGSHTERYEPSQGNADVVLRWIMQNQVKRLERIHARSDNGVQPRIMPSLQIGYRRSGSPVPTAATPAAQLDRVMVFTQVEGPSLTMSRSVFVSKLFRRALLSAFNESEAPDILHAHDRNGKQIQRNHLAFIPLPYMYGPRAGGQIRGIAIIFPHAAERDDVSRVYDAIRAITDSEGCISLREKIKLRALTAWSDNRKGTVNLERWRGESRVWTAATPVALDRHPGNLYEDKNPAKRHKAFEAAEKTVLDSIIRLGFPCPEAIEISTLPFLNGSAHLRSFPSFPQQVPGKPYRGRKLLVYTRVRFPEAVAGPLIIGAGRFCGLGLHIPTETEN